MRIGSSIFLIALGAILAFGVTIDPSPIAGLTVEWDVVGFILMIVGVVGLIWSIMLINSWRDRDALGERDIVERDRTIER